MNILKTFIFIGILTQFIGCSSPPPQPTDRVASNETAVKPLPPAQPHAEAGFTTPADQRVYQGIASVYSFAEHGNLTRSGEVYDVYAMTAAHPRWPMNTYVKVTHGKKTVVVRINDHNRDGLALKLSQQAAKELNLSAPNQVTFQAQAHTAPKQAFSLPTQQTIAAQKYYVQAGAFNQLENAQRIAAYVKQTMKLPAQIQQQAQWYRVQIGPFAELQARQLAERLPDYGLPRGFLVLDKAK